MSETISFICPHCSTRLDVPAELAGVTGPCPSCNTTITAPATSTKPPVPEHFPPVTSPTPEPPSNQIPAEDSHQAESDIPPLSQTSVNWRQPVKNALIGFISVVALAAATWGIAKVIEQKQAKNKGEIIAPIERIAPEAAPVNGDSIKRPEVEITKDGKVSEGNAIFPIVNTVKPPAISSASTTTGSTDAAFTANRVTDQTSAKVADLLGDDPLPIDPNLAPQSETDKMVIDSRKLITDFLAAETLEERLPMIFSERVPAAEMVETFADTMLGSSIEVAKTISRSPVIYLGQEGPNADGVMQKYFSVTLAASEDGSTPRRNIVIHMANQYEGKYRVNADAFLFCAENKLEQFINNPQSKPLIAYVFLERCHYKAGAEESPSGTFSVRLLAGPISQSTNTALVDAIDKPGAVLNPVVKWGIPPRAAIIELKHESNTKGQDTLSVDRVLKLNWLQSYQATPSDGE